MHILLVVVTLIIIGGYSINGYWWLSIGGYWCLLLVIILMVINGYSIDGY